jgi:hypothetical protein
VGEVISVYDKKGLPCETQVVLDKAHITLFILLTS